MNNQGLLLNERASLNRPSWSSESSTGMFNAHRHLHVSRMGHPVKLDHFVKTKGLNNDR